jgi:hypothetical protein
MTGTPWIILLSAALPLGAGYQELPGMDPAWSQVLEGSYTPGPGAPVGLVLRSPAASTWLDPAGLEPTVTVPGLHSAVHLAGIPRDIRVAAAVEDRYDWLPTFGDNPGHDRPWLRVDSEWTFAPGRRTVFVGVGATLPLTSPALGMPVQDPVAQATAARGQIGIYAGFRF